MHKKRNKKLHLTICFFNFELKYRSVAGQKKGKWNQEGYPEKETSVMVPTIKLKNERI